MGWTVSPKKECQVLTFRTCECDLIWKDGLCRHSQVQTKSYWTRVVPNLITGVFTRRGKFGHSDTHKEKMILRRDREKAMWQRWQRLSGSIYKAKIAGNHQKLGRSQEWSTLRVFRKSMALLIPWFWTSSLHICEKYISVVLKHPVCATLLQQP